jgi:hypothetical protein
VPYWICFQSGLLEVGRVVVGVVQVHSSVIWIVVKVGSFTSKEIVGWKNLIQCVQHWTIIVICHACLVVVLMKLFSRLNIDRSRTKSGLGMEQVGRQYLLAFRDALKGAGGYQACWIEPSATSSRMAFDNPLHGILK